MRPQQPVLPGDRLLGIRQRERLFDLRPRVTVYCIGTFDEGGSDLRYYTEDQIADARAYAIWLMLRNPHLPVWHWTCSGGPTRCWTMHRDKWPPELRSL